MFEPDTKSIEHKHTLSTPGVGVAKTDNVLQRRWGGGTGGFK